MVITLDSLKLVSAIFHYFYKTNVFLRYFEWSTLKINLTYICFFFPSSHEHSLSLELLRAAHLLKTSCFKNELHVESRRWYDVDIFQDEKITKRSESTNQAQTNINIVKGFLTYLNDLKNYPTTYQGFKIRLVVLKILGKYWYILNKWKIV